VGGTKQRAGTLAIALALAVVAAGCRRVEVVVYDRTSTPDLAQHYVTRDGTDTYALKLGAGAVRFTAPGTNASTPDGSQTRSVIWPPSTTASTTHQSCATWTDASVPGMQQGLVLRVRIDGSRFRAIVVAKNIWYGAEWQLNVYTWDSARSPYFRTHGAVALRTPFEHGELPTPLPWRVCARVDGDLVRLKGWRPGEPEPTWSSPTHGGSVRLPERWVYAGRAGWYAGHLPPGATVGMSGLRASTWRWVDGD
jgi:hypothetical protein